MPLKVKAELRDLLEYRGTCVSLYLPTHVTGQEVRQDPIRLKNLIRKANEALRTQGVPQNEIDAILTPARMLDQDPLYWKHQNEGLALFLAHEYFREFRVPQAVPELAVAGERFLLKPLLPLLGGEGWFYILAVSQNRVRLLRATEGSQQELDPADVPKNLAEAMRTDVPEQQIRFHLGPAPTPRGQVAASHAVGPSIDETGHKVEIGRFFHKIDEGLSELLRPTQAPLVFAGVEYLFPIYREANSYPHLVKEPVTGNPDLVPPEELRARAWEIVRPEFERVRDEDAERWRDTIGTGNALQELEEVVRTAAQGRVAALFARRDGQVWGRFDAATGTVEVHDAQQPGDEDLLDRAAADTILNGGRVYLVDEPEMPNRGLITASVRRIPPEAATP